MNMLRVGGWHSHMGGISCKFGNLMRKDAIAILQHTAAIDNELARRRTGSPKTGGTCVISILGLSSPARAGPMWLGLRVLGFFSTNADATPPRIEIRIATRPWTPPWNATPRGQ